MGVVSLLTGELVSASNGDADAKMDAPDLAPSHTQEAAMPDQSTRPPSFSPWAGLWLSLPVAFGAFVATWPLMGMSDGYVFPSVFCVMNLQQPGLGAVYVATYLFMVVSLSQGAIRVACGQSESESGRLRLICAALTGQALLCQLVPLFISFTGFAGYNTCDGFSLTMVLFGLLAFTAHLNQLLSPLFMLIWRRQMTIMINHAQERSALAAAAHGHAKPSGASDFAQVQA